MLKRLIARGSLWHFIAVGERPFPWEWPLIYFLFPALVFVFAPVALTSLFRTNASRQLMMFLPICQLPVLLTGKMWFVDVAWPLGLILMGATALQGPGWHVRRLIVSAVLAIHGGRMAVGGLILFGMKTKFTYVFKQDLQRYVHARLRWSEERGMPAKLWWIKAQHDTLQQCLANSVLLAVPVLVPAANTQPFLCVLEVVGWTCWLLAWLFECVADLQKQKFLLETRKQNTKDATLGLAPWNSSAYCLWTMCRHPNYFGEWCSWVGIVIASLPSLFFVCSESPVWVLGGFCVSLIYTLRLLYDCLVHWTGAVPAEFSSVAKRPGYAAYQMSVPCFWPHCLPKMI